jgi:hypothetical protein
MATASACELLLGGEGSGGEAVSRRRTLSSDAE